MNLSPQQEAARIAVEDWRRDPVKPFYLAGYAGTGKTTIAKALAEETETAFAAFTGKAASVMRSKGCVGASTIHQLIYRPAGEDEDGTLLFDRTGEPVDAELICIDECSMVDERIGADLLDLGVPVLVLGDPAQLPPVGGAGFFTAREPNYLLTEIHRQAADSGILAMATAVRERKDWRTVRSPDVHLIKTAALANLQWSDFDQVLCGTNATRKSLNVAARKARYGAQVIANPLPGDRLICLRNNHKRGLLNGEQWTVSACEQSDSDMLTMRIVNADNGRPATVHVWADCFAEDGEARLKSMPYQERRHAEEFNYAYAMTVHKAQGSQWDKVLIINEASAFRADAFKWLYTAITRAAKQVTVTV